MPPARASGTRSTQARGIAGYHTTGPTGATGVVIVYGRGDSLGDLKVFAEDLRDELGTKQGPVLLKKIEGKDEFFDYLANTAFPFAIKELHIMSHAFGAGLALGYGSPAAGQSRQSAFDRAQSQSRSVTATEVLDAEIGVIFTDDLTRSTFTVRRADIQSKFAASATIKIWGCNAAIENWVYSDDDYTGDGAADAYWSVLNGTIGKPSIAQAIANYFQRRTFAASSGAHVEVLVGGTWITSQQYRQRHGKWPNPARFPHRLAPDRGTYQIYSPRP